MKNTRPLNALLVISTLFLATPLHAQTSAFADGPVIMGYGKNAPVPSHSVSSDAQFKVAFDVASTGEKDQVNRKIDSVARFINMHANAGVSKDNIELALVVHGKAALDVLDTPHYKSKHGVDNPNKPLLKLLMQNNVRVILCGQSAAAHGITKSQLIEGIDIELSAMTAHALLQQVGYTVNPF